MIDAVKSLGGNIKVIYNTPLTLDIQLKPHKHVLGHLVKTPMPPPQKVLKLEAMKLKGVDVEYPKAPWFDDYMLNLQKEI